MTKQEFLAFSLPHGLCVISECDLDNRDYDEICIYKPYHYTDEFIEKFITSDVQLAILRPLSDLTKEIEHKGERFVPIEKLRDMGFYIGEDWIIENFSNITNSAFEFVLKLIEWHFDIAGLIEKGEAIDVNTLPENPYK